MLTDINLEDFVNQHRHKLAGNVMLWHAKCPVHSCRSKDTGKPWEKWHDSKKICLDALASHVEDVHAAQKLSRRYWPGGLGIAGGRR